MFGVGQERDPIEECRSKQFLKRRVFTHPLRRADPHSYHHDRPLQDTPYTRKTRSARLSGLLLQGHDVGHHVVDVAADHVLREAWHLVVKGHDDPVANLFFRSELGDGREAGCLKLEGTIGFDVVTARAILISDHPSHLQIAFLGGDNRSEREQDKGRCRQSRYKPHSCYPFSRRLISRRIPSSLHS